MKKILSITMIFFLGLTLIAQAQKKDSTLKIIKKDTLWHKSYLGGLNFNQSSFSSNWYISGFRFYKRNSA